ncbi:MAG: efflux RND transporter periplasmic adaptor subunit [Burkholderiales bacterium]|nr:efflux RND transporter periplasmic adaptor subunit [Burkholderiales bacterium]
MKKTSIAIIFLAIAGGAWYGWSRGNGDTNSAKVSKEGKDAPPTPVSLVVAKRQDVPVILTANASVSPVASVDLRPQVSNTIAKVHVHEGETVKQGQLLFSLDQRNEMAGLERAKAQLAKDQAGLLDLQRQLRRSDELLAKNFISRGANDTLLSQLQAQQATLALDQANLHSAQIALDYTSIKAPMTGRIGSINVFPGSLVQATTTLAQINQINPINISFTVPEDQLGKLLAAQQNGAVTVQTTPAGSSTSLVGKLSFIDNTVDTQSGTIKLKAEFDNQKQLLWPGQYTTASLTVTTLKDVVVIPVAAVITNAKGKSVFTVEADQSAKQRPISLLHTFGSMVAVSGLDGGEKVILEGRQNLRPGGKIKEMSASDKGDKAKDKKDSTAKPTEHASKGSAA